MRVSFSSLWYKQVCCFSKAMGDGALIFKLGFGGQIKGVVV